MRPPTPLPRNSPLLWIMTRVTPLFTFPLGIVLQFARAGAVPLIREVLRREESVLLNIEILPLSHLHDLETKMTTKMTTKIRKMGIGMITTADMISTMQARTKA